MSKLFFSNHIQKGIVDILLLAGFISLFPTMGKDADSYNWGSWHCIVGIAWTLLMLVHTCQHWHLVKAFTKKKVILKNKITALTIFVFILMLISIIRFIIKIDEGSTVFHHGIAHLFPVIVIIHVIQKWKRLISLFQNKSKKTI